MKGDGMTTGIQTCGGQNSRHQNLARELNFELPFFCQFDEKIHSSLESAYWCDKCGIYLCGSCYTALATVVGLTACHHCQGALTLVFGLV